MSPPVPPVSKPLWISFRPRVRKGVYTGGATATEKMAVIELEYSVAVSGGWTSDELTYDASLRLPAGWKFGTSLPVASQSGDEIKFAPISLTMLVDGPVITGQYLKVVPLNPGQTPPVEMDVAADSAAALEPTPRFGSTTKTWSRKRARCLERNTTATITFSSA